MHLARFLSAECGAMTAVEHTKVPNCDYAEDIVLMTNSPTHLQSQLDRFYRYTQRKGLELNTDKDYGLLHCRSHFLLVQWHTVGGC